LSRSPTLAELEAQLRDMQRAFMAEADRVDPRTATEEELRALDAKALPLQALTNQIRRLRPVAQLRRELEATRTMQHEVARSETERELFRKNADELESLLAERLQRRAASVRRVVVGVAGLVLLAAGAWFAWYL
jgi:uncharacterized protein YhaN